jgi:hypothetical protein
MGESGVSQVARRAFLARGVAIGLTGAAAAVFSNIEQLMAAPGASSGAGFSAYMAHDQARADKLLGFMMAKGYSERPEYSVAAQGEHVDIWGRGTRPFDVVQSIMSGPGGFAVLVGQGPSSPTPGAPNAQVWKLPVDKTKPLPDQRPSEVYIAENEDVQGQQE